MRDLYECSSCYEGFAEDSLTYEDGFSSLSGDRWLCHDCLNEYEDDNG